MPRDTSRFRAKEYSSLMLPYQETGPPSLFAQESKILQFGHLLFWDLLVSPFLTQKTISRCYLCFSGWVQILENVQIYYLCFCAFSYRVLLRTSLLRWSVSDARWVASFFHSCFSERINKIDTEKYWTALRVHLSTIFLSQSSKGFTATVLQYLTNILS